MSRFGEAVQSATDDFVAGRFATTKRGKAAQERSDNRYDASSQDNGVSDEATAGRRDTGLAINRERTHLLTGRPDPESSLGDPAFQAAAFEANSTTKAEGESKEMLKGALDQIKTARESFFTKRNRPAGEEKVTGLIGVPTSTITELPVENLMKPAEIKKFVDLDHPERHLRWSASGPESDLYDNTQTVFESLYGDGLSQNIDDFINEKVQNDEGTDVSEDLRVAMETFMLSAIPGLSDTLPTKAYDKDALSSLVSQTIKNLLIENPDKATQILTQLQGDAELDLDGIAGFRDMFNKNLVNYTLDAIEEKNPDYFDTTSVSITKISDGTNQSFTPVQLDTSPEWNALSNTEDIKLNPHQTTGVIVTAESVQLDTYIDNNAFAGLTSINKELRASLQQLGAAMTLNPSDTKFLFDQVFSSAIKNGVDPSKGSLDRITAFSKTAEQLRAKVIAGGLADEASINKLIASMEAFSLPELILQGTQRELTQQLIASFPTLPPELAGLGLMDLRDDINLQIETGNISSVLFERLSTIAVALPDKALQL